MKLKNFYILAFALITLLTSAFSVTAQLDSSFGTDGIAQVNVLSDDKPLETYLLPDGKIFIINKAQISLSNYKYFFVRLNSDGSPDTTFGTNGAREVQLPAGIPFPETKRMASGIRQSDGKIVMIGDGYVLRFNEDGTPDLTFSGDGYHTPNVDQNGGEDLIDVIQQPDGKLVVIGNVYAHSSGAIRVFLVRYEQNGSLDLDFGDQFGFIIHSLQYYYFGELFLQSNGKFLVSPAKRQLQNDFYASTAAQRFNSDGTVDNTFTPVVFASNAAIDAPRSFKLLSDDTFLIATSKLINDNLLRKHTNIVISRYTANGTPDVNFGTNGKAEFDMTSAMTDEAFALGEQSDGKIVVAGITNIEPNRNKILGSNLTQFRLSASGALEGKFLVTNLLPYLPDFTTRPLQYRSQIHIQPDGKILTQLTKSNEMTGEDIMFFRTTNVPLQTIRLHGIPFSFLNYNYSNASIYRPSNRNWYFNPSVEPVFFGLAQDVLAPSDFLGDFRTDLAVFRPSEGTWYIARPNGVPANDYLTVKWGKAGDIPMPRDYNGDSKSDIAVFRPSDGTWYIRHSGDDSHRIQPWGMDGDKPVSGDYDGDGIDDIAVWRPSTGTWYIRKSTDGQAIIMSFGLSTDIPVQEDYDGDGKCDIAVYRPSTGTWYIYRSSDFGYTIFNWGLSNDIPTPSDYDGDGKIDIAIWRPSSRNWFIYYSSSASYAQFVFGLNADIPTQGRF